MSTQDLVDELHTCFKAFDSIIQKYRIEKIKTIGDVWPPVWSKTAMPERSISESAYELVKE